MKIGLFTDAHYSSQEVTCKNRYNSRSLKKIREAYERFAKEGCDLIISLGDLIDRENDHKTEVENLSRIAEIIKASPVPTVCLMGNHDGFTFTEDEYYGILGGCRPENMTVEGKTLLFVDACYFKNGKRYMPGDRDWTDTFYPHSDTLKTTLSSISGGVYIFMHQNIDPNIPKNHRLFNADELCGIIEKSGSVSAVYQGHYHPGASSEQKGVKYITLPAMCENDAAVFTVEI